MSKADKMFEEMGFKKNTSACYNDKHIFYERNEEDYHDISTIEFKQGYYIYTSLHMRAMRTSGPICSAIYQKMKELGWL